MPFRLDARVPVRFGSLDSQSSADTAIAEVAAAYRIEAEAPPERPLLIDVVRG